MIVFNMTNGRVISFNKKFLIYNLSRTQLLQKPRECIQINIKVQVKNISILSICFLFKTKKFNNILFEARLKYFKQFLLEHFSSDIYLHLQQSTPRCLSQQSVWEMPTQLYQFQSVSPSAVCLIHSQCVHKYVGKRERKLLPFIVHTLLYKLLIDLQEQKLLIDLQDGAFLMCFVYFYSRFSVTG